MKNYSVITTNLSDGSQNVLVRGVHTSTLFSVLPKEQQHQHTNTEVVVTLLSKFAGIPRLTATVQAGNKAEVLRLIEPLVDALEGVPSC